MPARHSKIPILLTILLTLPFDGSAVEKLRDGETCSMMYQKALGNNTSIDFTVPIGGLSCPPGTGVYHCLIDENNLHSQECRPQNWMKEGWCPRIYSFSRNWNPVACNINATGCPKNEYWSNEYYKYSACFGTGSETTTGRKTISSKEKYKEEGNKSTNVVVIVVPVVLVTIIICVVGPLIFIVVWRKRSRQQAEVSNPPESHPLTETQEEESNPAQSCSPTATPEGDRFCLQCNALHEAMEALKVVSCILVTGKQGSGVSTLTDFIKVKYPQKDVIVLQNYEEFDEIEENKIYLLETSFQNEMVPFQKLNELYEFIGKIRAKESFVIIEARYSWFKENLVTIKSELKDKFKVVDLSSEELRPSLVDRKTFLEAECTKQKICLKDDEQKALLEYDEEHCGIPLLYIKFLKQYSKNPKSNPRELLKEIDGKYKLSGEKTN